VSTCAYLGIRTTTPTRALYDLAPSLTPHRLRELFERCEYLDVLDRRRLAELLEPGGRHALRDPLAYEPLPLAEVKSRLEQIVLSTCRAHSLPVPLVNVPVLDYEVDFFWPDARFIVEADGGQHRGERRERDNSRDTTLARAGLLSRRYTEFALADEAAVGAEVAEILATSPSA
jgi:very-short-patch-repair endonuclease